MISTQYSRDRSNSIISSTSLRPSYYDPITGDQREYGVNISIGNIITTVPINNKTIDTVAAITMTSIKSDWVEDYYNLNRSSLATDMVRVDISDNLESIGSGSCNNNDFNDIIFRLPLKTTNLLNTPPVDSKTHFIFCRRNEPCKVTYDCYGRTMILECDGIGRYNSSITCEYQKIPTCVLPSELYQLMNPPTNQSLSVISNDICTTINYGKEYVIRSCNLCKVSAYNKRRLQTSTTIDDSENIEVVAMVEYVVIDTANVLYDVELLWDGDTYNQTIPITLFFSSVWIVFAIYILQAEKNVTKNDDGKKSTEQLVNNNHGDNNNGEDETSGNEDELLNDRMNDVKSIIDYIHSIFPKVYNIEKESAIERLFLEIKNEHLFVKPLMEKILSEDLCVIW